MKASTPAKIPPRPEAPLPIAVSECLTGSEVRYDGSGARSSYPHAALEGLFSLRGVCPEMGIGMPVPRPPIRLVGFSDTPKVAQVDDPSKDFTEPLRQFGRDMAARLDEAGICGYVFMKNSPSCGLFRVKVYTPNKAGEVGMPVRAGRGAYADALTRAWPTLPVEESGRLSDPVLRENFVTRVFAYAHWRAFLAHGVSAGGLVAFHTRYKYLLMAHSVPHYKRAGRLLANLREDLEATAEEYAQVLMSGLARPASRGGHANVLSHLQGYFKRDLTPQARQELAQLVEAYRRDEQPLLAVLALLKHHLSTHPDAYLEEQVYFSPHPTESGLRRRL